MSVEFVDTNIFIYAHDKSAGPKHDASVALLERLFDENSGAVSTQVLSEFYSIATKKLRMPGEEAEAVIEDLAGWAIHRPDHADILRASRLHRRHRISWWDALVLNSAMELGCKILWSEDLAHGHSYGKVTVRSPFRQA